MAVETQLTSSSLNKTSCVAEFQASWGLASQILGKSGFEVKVDVPVPITTTEDFDQFIRSGYEERRVLDSDEYAYASDLVDDVKFQSLSLANDGYVFLSSFRVVEYVRKGGEAYCAVDFVVTLNPEGVVEVVPMVKKAIIAGGARVPGALAATTSNRVKRLENIRDLGIPTVNIFGATPEEAVIYEQLYPGVLKKSVFGVIDSKLEGWKVYLDQLIDIVRKLDEGGIVSMNFLSDLTFDGEQFIYLDGGSDLSESSLSNDWNMQVLVRRFPEHQTYILNALKKTSREEVSNICDESSTSLLAAIE